MKNGKRGWGEVEREIQGGLRDRWMQWVREGNISASGVLSWVETDRLQGWFLLLWLTPSLQCWDRQAQTLRHAQLVVSWNILEGKSTKAKTVIWGTPLLFRFWIYFHAYNVGVYLPQTRLFLALVISILQQEYQPDIYILLCRGNLKKQVCSSDLSGWEFAIN